MAQSVDAWKGFYGSNPLFEYHIYSIVSHSLNFFHHLMRLMIKSDLHFFMS